MQFFPYNVFIIAAILLFKHCFLDSRELNICLSLLQISEINLGNPILEIRKRKALLKTFSPLSLNVALVMVGGETMVQRDKFSVLPGQLRSNRV